MACILRMLTKSSEIKWNSTPNKLPPEQLQEYVSNSLQTNVVKKIFNFGTVTIVINSNRASTCLKFKTAW